MGGCLGEYIIWKMVPWDDVVDIYGIPCEVTINCAPSI